MPSEESDAIEVIKLIEKEGRKAITIPGDIRNEKFCTTLVEKAFQQLGGLDILINNTGYQQAVTSITELTTESFLIQPLKLMYMHYFGLLKLLFHF